jgi:hypothetical protein
LCLGVVVASQEEVVVVAAETLTRLEFASGQQSQGSASLPLRATAATSGGRHEAIIACEDGSIWVYDMRDLQGRQVFKDSVAALAILAVGSDGLLVGMADGRVVFDAYDGSRYEAPLHGSCVRAISYDDTTGLGVSGDDDGALTWWRLSSGGIEPGGEWGIESGVSVLAVPADEGLICVGDVDGLLHVFWRPDS